MTTDLRIPLSGIAFFICGVAATSMSAPWSRVPSQQIPDSKKTSGERFLPLPKCRRDTESAPVWSNVPKYERPWLSSVLGLAGGREAWKAWISRIFFVCLTCSALDRWGKKTDISVPCPMSRSAKQDLPFVRLLSVVFLSANEFWKSENSREKVHTRCPRLHVCIVYLLYENCKSTSYEQLTRNGGCLKSIN